MTEDHSDPESENAVDVDVDLYLRNVHVGAILSDITEAPTTTLSDIIDDIADMLGVSSEDIFISEHNVRLPNSTIIKDFLDNRNLQPNKEYYLILRVNENIEHIAAHNLKLKAEPRKEEEFIVLMGESPDRETELTIFTTKFFNTFWPSELNN